MVFINVSKDDISNVVELSSQEGGSNEIVSNLLIHISDTPRTYAYGKIL